MAGGQNAGTILTNAVRGADGSARRTAIG